MESEGEHRRLAVILTVERYAPHPPFGHLLPAGGEKADTAAAALLPLPACGERAG